MIEFIRDFLRKSEHYNPDHELIYGALFVILLLVLVRLVFLYMRTKKCVGITLNGEHGQLFISATAIEDFIIRTLADTNEMVIDRVKLTKKSHNYAVTLVIRVTSEARVSDLCPAIEEKILSQAVDRLGVDSIKTVNINLKNFSAKERQINKRHKLAVKEAVKEQQPTDDHSP